MTKSEQLQNLTAQEAVLAAKLDKIVTEQKSGTISNSVLEANTLIIADLVKRLSEIGEQMAPLIRNE